MATVTASSQTSNSNSIDEAVKQAVNVSDATQMENNFISLMVAQIKYQDPTKPVDSTEFLNQFSAMSQVKSMENLATLAQNNLVLIDEILTPDSSRFWPAAEYRTGISPPSFDKQIIRDWLETTTWNKKPPAPVPGGFINKPPTRSNEPGKPQS